MPVVPRKTLDEIRFRNDIAEVIGSFVRLQRAGANFRALCPFHKEKTPSFNVNTEKQIFHCFGCGAGGDVFGFVMKYEGLDFMGAVRYLAQRAHIEVEVEDGERKTDRDVLLAIHARLASDYHDGLLRSPRAEAARRYLAERELGPEIVEEFQIGYSPPVWDFIAGWGRKHKFPEEKLAQAGLIARSERAGASGRWYDRFRDRLMFPICDEQGRVVAFSGRLLAADAREAKYVNSPETPIFRKGHILYALHRARHPMVESRTAIICEGQIDVIRCHAAGFRNAVAAQGTAFTEDHARVVRRYADSVVLVFDPDAAGQNAAIKAATLFLQAGLDVRVVALPPGQDPDLFIRRQGPEEFRRRIDAAQDAVGFLIGVLSAREDVRSPAGMRRIEHGVFDMIARMPSEVEKSILLDRAAARLGVHPSDLRRDMVSYGARSVRRSPEPAPPEAGEDSAPGEAPAPIPVEEMVLLEHMAAAPELAKLAGRYVPLAFFSEGDSRRLAEAAIRAAEAGETLGESLARLDERNERIIRLAAAVEMAPIKTPGREFDREAAVKDLVLRLWKRELTRRRAAVAQDQKDGGDLHPDVLQLTSDVKWLRTWEDGLPIIEAHLAEGGQAPG